jgi:hypothetical protein
MTVSLVDHIALPVSSPLSYRLAFDTMGKLANYGKLGAAADPDAVIEALFANSEVGAWYDPSDLTTMFQDRAGTTPVTADGQTVGKILDKSGNDNHAVAPSDAARPLYKTDGTYHWLQYDGVDDSLSTAAIDFTVTDKISAFFGTSTSSSANQGIITNGVTGAGGWNAIYALGTPPSIRGSLTGDSSFSQVIVDGDSSGTKQIVSQVYDIAGSTATDEIKIRKNGSLPTQTVVSAGPAGGGAMQNTTVDFGNYVGLMLAGNIYSMIIRGTTSTTQEITDTETWVNSKTGAY